MLKKVITAQLNDQNLIENPASPSEIDIAKKAELLEKAKKTVATTEEKANNDEQAKSEATN